MIKKDSKKNVAGFTLVELLVVISIIAILLAILMPTLGKAKYQAKIIVCKNNVKQIVIGMSAGANANGGKYSERDTDADPHKIWWFNQFPDDNGFWKMYRSYVCGDGVKNPDFSFCPLRDRKADGGALNPGCVRSSPTADDSEAGKYVYVFDKGYKIGYSIFAGIKEPPTKNWFKWDESGNSVTNSPPKIAGSSRDVIVTDYVEICEVQNGWYTPHAIKKAPYGYLNGRYRWNLSNVYYKKIPKEGTSVTVGFGDGHVILR
jgi:prepilin-type N-terminal cleavage/methylation domain-containing protein